MVRARSFFHALNFIHIHPAVFGLPAIDRVLGPTSLATYSHLSSRLHLIQCCDHFRFCLPAPRHIPPLSFLTKSYSEKREAGQCVEQGLRFTAASIRRPPVRGLHCRPCDALHGHSSDGRTYVRLYCHIQLIRGGQDSVTRVGLDQYPTS